MSAAHAATNLGQPSPIALCACKRRHGSHASLVMPVKHLYGHHTQPALQGVSDLPESLVQNLLLR